MARSEIQRLYDNGMVSERELKRVRTSKAKRNEYAGDYALSKSRPSGAIGSNAINENQRNDAPGGGKTKEFGPSDASVGRGAIDKRENRREFPNGVALKGKAPSVVAVGRSRNTKGWPTDAQVRRISANEFHPDWYSDGPTRQD